MNATIEPDLETEVGQEEETVLTPKRIGILNLNAAIVAAHLVREHGILDEDLREHPTGRPLLYQTNSTNWRYVYEALHLPCPDVPRMPDPELAKVEARIAEVVNYTDAEKEALAEKVRVDDGERECSVCHEVLPLKKFPTRKDRSRESRCRACRQEARA